MPRHFARREDRMKSLISPVQRRPPVLPGPTPREDDATSTAPHHLDIPPAVGYEDAPAPRYASRSLYETVEVRSRLPIESCIISINSRSPCCAIDL